MSNSRAGARRPGLRAVALSRAAWCALGLLGGGLVACGGGSSGVADAGTPSPSNLGEALDELIEAHGVASISVGIVQDGEPVALVARGWADAEAERAATPETIYALASCSKPIVGLAAALLVEEMPDIGLDDDVQAWLDWDPPLAHPDHPDSPITLRMLLKHRAGIASDSPAYYETYPKPDPDVPLEDFLQPLLADPTYWIGAPGEAESYSNLGVALAGLVIERAAGQDFRTFCETRIFEPLGMHDTRWFYGDLSAAQQARHAVPYDADGEPYAIYGFNDYPSGLLRSTAPDMTRLIAALTDGGRIDGAQALPAAAVARFHDDALSIDVEGSGDARFFDHSGGEAGVTTYFGYRADGAGYVYLINGDLDDGPADDLGEALEALLIPLAGLD